MSSRPVRNPLRLLVLVPLAAALFLVCASVLQKLYLGVNVFVPQGYVTPAVAGLVAGLLIAFWFLRAQRNLVRAEDNADALARLNRRHRTLLDSAGEGIYGLDERGCCTFVNRAALGILGYAEDELLGQEVHRLIHHSHLDGSPFPREECPLRQAAARGGPIPRRDDVLWHKEGRPVRVEYIACPLEGGSEDEGGLVVLFRDVTHQRSMEERVQFMSTYDPVTGLLNRQAFEQRLAVAVDAVAREDVQHTLCYLDVDQFRIVNDTLGHMAGDALLGEVARVLGESIRPGDVAGRLGGDEFGLLLQDCPWTEGARRVEALRGAIEALSFIWEGEVVAVSACVGGCPIDEHTQDVTSALQDAHTTCLLAKEGGRNCSRLLDRDDEAYRTLHDQMRWVARIRRALDEDRLFLRYQRIEPLPLGGSGVNAFEVLVSMRDEDGRIIPPDGFLPAAERYGLMPDVDRWVLGRIFAWLDDHPERHGALDFVSINLAGPSFGDESLMAFIEGEVRRRRLPAPKVCFEVTETAAIRNLSRAGTFMAELRRLGCRFSLDDFGSGMSSFGYLKNLPVDCIKVDGGFVRDAATDPLARAIIESIHHVSQAVGIRTIAEQVEDEKTRRVMEEIGIDYLQGYLIHRPEPLQ